MEDPVLRITLALEGIPKLDRMITAWLIQTYIFNVSIGNIMEFIHRVHFENVVHEGAMGKTEAKDKLARRYLPSRALPRKLRDLPAALFTY